MKTKKIKRFVLDTNVVISLIIADNIEILAIQQKKNSLEYYSCICHIDEIKRNIHRLHQKGKISDPFTLIGNVTNFFIINNIEHTFNKSPDPKDNFLYDIAIQFNAVIVTRENALLSFDKSPVKTINLNSFLRLF